MLLLKIFTWRRRKTAVVMNKWPQWPNMRYQAHFIHHQQSNMRTPSFTCLSVVRDNAVVVASTNWFWSCPRYQESTLSKIKYVKKKERFIVDEKITSLTYISFELVGNIFATRETDKFFFLSLSDTHLYVYLRGFYWFQGWSRNAARSRKNGFLHFRKSRPHTYVFFFFFTTSKTKHLIWRTSVGKICTIVAILFTFIVASFIDDDPLKQQFAIRLVNENNKITY